MADDGRGFYGNPEEHARAGEKGGETTKREHGKEFYEEIGSEGGQAQSTSSDDSSTSSDGRGWHGDSEGHAEAGRQGGQSS